jgi:hypothetical protein
MFPFKFGVVRFRLGRFVKFGDVSVNHAPCLLTGQSTGTSQRKAQAGNTKQVDREAHVRLFHPFDDQVTKTQAAPANRPQQHHLLSGDFL